VRGVWVNDELVTDAGLVKLTADLLALVGADLVPAPWSDR